MTRILCALVLALSLLAMPQAASADHKQWINLESVSGTVHKAGGGR